MPEPAPQRCPMPTTEAPAPPANCLMLAPTSSRIAIPADEALRGRAEALGRGESAASPRLGVAIAPGHVARRLRRAVGLPDADGLLIREVMQDTPAARAGLAQGDLIVTAAGQPVRSPDDLFDALQAAAGGTIELTVVRGADERVIQVDFGGNGQPGQGV